MGFREKLAERQRRAKTLVCVGLDPLIEKMPEHLMIRNRSLTDNLETWMKGIVQSTAPYASMFKPQSAHWEAIPGGPEVLIRLVNFIREEFPTIPALLDCKRGDISRTQQQYRTAILDIINVEGMNFSPYMGRDCMAALVHKESRDKALVGLCYTSNPDAREVQDLHLVGYEPAQHLWEKIALLTLRWAEELGVVENAGLVMAAAYEQPPKGSGIIYSDHLTRCRELVGDKLWFLIPGVGAQGGFIEETVRAAYTGPGSIAINSSSEINFASSGKDFAEAAAQKAQELRDAINNALAEAA